MDTITEQLRQKIKSKMDVAKFTAGFISITFSLTFENIFDTLRVQFSYFICISAFTALLSIGLFISSMYAYDRLLMPPNFWQNDKKPIDNDELNNILFCEMKKAWNKLFTPGIICFFISLISFLHVGLDNLYITIGFIFGLLALTIYFNKYSNIGIRIHG